MTKALCIRYTFIMIGIGVLSGIIALPLDYFFGFEWPLVFNIAALFITAMLTGDYCFTKLNEMPDKKTIWKLAFYFTIIQFVMGVITIAIFILVAPEISDLIGELGIDIWVAIYFFTFLIFTLINRFGFLSGINRAKKKADAKKVKE